MRVYLEGHSFGYEVQRIVQMFFPGEKVETVPGAPAPDVREGIHTRLADGLVLAAYLPSGRSEFDDWLPGDSRSQLEHKFGVVLYQLLSQVTGMQPPWGILTGVRPVKLLVQKQAAGLTPAQLEEYFCKSCLVSENKFSLALQTAGREQEILRRSTPDSFSLYVSIPFCPTRCSYCSFVSHSVEQAAKLMPSYLDRLCEELALTGRIAAQLGLKLRTVYFGGGTPTTLSAAQLERLMAAVGEAFDLSQVWEYTVEAGRPDTVTPEKMRVLKRMGATRVSINPQTLSDRVLQAIGRRHTVDQFFRAWEQAREAGFHRINADLIAGLPLDDPSSFRQSVEGVLRLQPENLTVHTLTVKRSARLTFEEARGELETVGEMVEFARRAVTQAGLAPYYLYRQTGTLGSLENVGYALPGTEGLYNVYIMDETHSILAVGAGASTKLRHPKTGALTRIYNYKYPYEYLSRFQQVQDRKGKILEFYRSGGEGACQPGADVV